MDVDTAAKRAGITVTVQAAAGSLVNLRSLLYYVAKSSTQAAALRTDPPPTPAEVAVLLADVPAARTLLAASRAGRAAIRRADESPSPARTGERPPARPIAAAVASLFARLEELPTQIKRLPSTHDTVENACKTMLAVDGMMSRLEKMAATLPPQALATLEMLAGAEEEEVS